MCFRFGQVLQYYIACSLISSILLDQLKNFNCKFYLNDILVLFYTQINFLKKGQIRENIFDGE